jgi:hypothetical protein
VDDTDFYGISDEEFISDVQEGLTDWGMLVQASGGSLKQSKSFWYLLSWKFVRGKPTLKPQSNLPNISLLIPQPDGTQLPIDRCDNLETKKTLGVWNNPLNDYKSALKELKDIGLEWVDNLRARPLEKRDTWLSLTAQQYPKWGYMESRRCTLRQRSWMKPPTPYTSKPSHSLALTATSTRSTELCPPNIKASTCDNSLLKNSTEI